MDYLQKVPVILRDDLQCESHRHSRKVRIARDIISHGSSQCSDSQTRNTATRPCVSPTSVTWSYLPSTNIRNIMCCPSSSDAGDQRSRVFEPALDSCDVSPYAPTFLVSNTRNFTEITLYIVPRQICRAGLKEITKAYEHNVGPCAVRRTWDLRRKKLQWVRVHCYKSVKFLWTARHTSKTLVSRNSSSAFLGSWYHHCLTFWQRTFFFVNFSTPCI